MNKLEIEYYPINTKLYSLEYNKENYKNVNSFYIRKWVINDIIINSNTKVNSIQYCINYTNVVNSITISSSSINKKYYVSIEELIENLKNLKIEYGI